MYKWLSLLILLWVIPAHAQNTTCATRPNGDSSNACASTAFVKNQGYLNNLNVGTTPVINGTNGYVLTDNGGILGNVPQPFYIGTASINADIAAVGSTPTTIIYTIPTTLSANLTIPATVTLFFAQSGYVTQGAANFLAINGNVQAGRYKIFNGFTASQITFGIGRITQIFPEWWGAIADNATVDDVPMQAAFASMANNSGQVIVLTGGGYLLNTCGLTLFTGGTGIIGSSYQSTGFICTSASGDIIDVAGSGTGNSRINGNFFRDFYLIRTVAPNGSTKGLSAVHTINTTIDRILSANNAFGFYFSDIADSYCNDCIANIVQSAAITWIGIFFDGTTYGPNESNEVSLGAAAVGGGVTVNTSYGILMQGNWISDFTIRHFETASVFNGVYLNNTGSATNVSTDIHLDGIVNDQFGGSGILLNNIIATGNVTISDGWNNPAQTASTPSGIDLIGSSGVSIIGTQETALGTGSPNTNTVCVNINSTSNHNTVTGNTLNGCAYGVLVSSSSFNTITGNTFYNASAQAATDDIDLVSAPANSITGNTLDGYATNGILGDAASYSTVISNNIVNTAHIGTALNGVYAIGQNSTVTNSTTLSTGTPKDVASLTLPGGIWQVCGNVSFTPDTTTTTQYAYGWISTTSATYPTPPGPSYLNGAAVVAGIASGGSTGCKVLNLATNTAVYLSAQSGFSVSTMAVQAAIVSTRLE